MYQRYLRLDLEERQSIFLWGPRKVGKSTYLKSNYPDSVYYDLLKTDIYQKYLKSPHLLREEILAMNSDVLKTPVIIDEVQKIPALLDEIHWIIENSEASFILCGSSARKLKLYGTNLLGGRALKYHFYPLVYPEYKKDFDLLRIFNNGLIPAHFSSSNPRKLLKAYIEDYLAHEIQAEGLVRNITAFSRFMDSIVFSHGELINYSNIARDCGIDAKTVKEYYQILVDTLVGYLIYPYSKRVSREIISATPKFYFFDVGIADRLANRKLVETKGPDAGRSLEHYVLMELVSYIGLNDLDHKVNYWRTKSGLEVDFIISENRYNPLPIEVKIAENPHHTELRGLKAFMAEHSISTGYVVSLAKMPRKVDLGNKAIYILPIQEFLEQLWDKKIFR